MTNHHSFEHRPSGYNKRRSKTSLTVRALAGLGIQDLCGAIGDYMVVSRTKGGVSCFSTQEDGGSTHVFVDAAPFNLFQELHINREAHHTLDIVRVYKKSPKDSFGLKIDMISGDMSALPLKPMVLAGLTKVLADHSKDACVDMPKIKNEAELEAFVLQSAFSPSANMPELRPLLPR